ncbi:MAG: hypothetical protein ACRDLQ_05485 [Solirubrobacterales bacterium]
MPAYNQCTSANRTHGPPLAFPSCNPPVQSSQSVTVGTPDANGAAANAVAHARVSVVVGVPGAPDDSDVKLSGASTDIRCKTGVAACGSTNAAGGPDYTGELQANATIRITDHFSALAPGGGTDPATVTDIPFPTTVSCTATASTSIGSACSVATTANAIVPGSVKDGKRAIVETREIFAIDGGPDGLVGTEPNTRLAMQGIFIP